MPNRGPIELSDAEAAALLAELPPPVDPRDMDADDRRRAGLLAALRSRLAEVRESMSESGRSSASAVLSIDEAEELLDCLPPPPVLGSVRQRLAQFRQDVLSGAIVAAAPAAPAGRSSARPPAGILPVTVFTGALGAGKTTVIRSLLDELPPGYTCAWLKNEYGDALVDSAVAADARIAVREVTNGCLCCTRVGELPDALKALHDLSPSRIFVEASGSALPAQLVWEIQKLTSILRVDGVVTVVDCLNFERINDFSRSARLQAACTNLILLNKVEAAGEARVDAALDDLNELVPETPKVRTVGERGIADPALVFGLDQQLLERTLAAQTPALTAGPTHMLTDAESYHVLPAAVPEGWRVTRGALEALLAVAPPDELYRAKGIVRLDGSTDAQPAEPACEWWLFNGVAGRLTLERLHRSEGPTSLVVMGQDLARRVRAMAEALGLPEAAIVSAAPPAEGGLISRGIARGLCAPCGPAS